MFFHIDKDAIEAAGARMRTVRLGSIFSLDSSSPLDTHMATLAVKQYIDYLVEHTNLEHQVECISNGLESYSAQAIGRTNEEIIRFTRHVDLMLQVLIVANANPDLAEIETLVRKLFSKHTNRGEDYPESLIRVLALLLSTRNVTIDPKILEGE